MASRADWAQPSGPASFRDPCPGLLHHRSVGPSPYFPPLMPLSCHVSASLWGSTCLSTSLQPAGAPCPLTPLRWTQCQSSPSLATADLPSTPTSELGFHPRPWHRGQTRLPLKRTVAGRHRYRHSGTLFIQAASTTDRYFLTVLGETWTQVPRGKPGEDVGRGRLSTR